MLTSFIACTVRFSVRHAILVIMTSLALCAISCIYVAKHFAISTDISALIDSNQPWAQRGRDIDKAFPLRADLTLVVVDAPAAEFAEQAADELAASLDGQPQLFSRGQPAAKRDVLRAQRPVISVAEQAR